MADALLRSEQIPDRLRELDTEARMLQARVEGATKEVRQQIQEALDVIAYRVDALHQRLDAETPQASYPKHYHE